MGQIFETVSKANHTHTRWYNMSPLRESDDDTGSASNNSYSFYCSLCVRKQLSSFLLRADGYILINQVWPLDLPGISISRRAIRKTPGSSRRPTESPWLRWSPTGEHTGDEKEDKFRLIMKCYWNIVSLHWNLQQKLCLRAPALQLCSSRHYLALWDVLQ